MKLTVQIEAKTPEELAAYVRLVGFQVINKQLEKKTTDIIGKGGAKVGEFKITY